MEKLAYREDNPYPQFFRNEDWSKKEKTIGVAAPIAGATLGAIRGALKTRRLKKTVENAEQRRDSATTDASRAYWNRTIDRYKPLTDKAHNIKRIAGNAAVGAGLGASVPLLIHQDKRDNKKRNAYYKRQAEEWDRDFNEFDRQSERRRAEWDRTWEDFRRQAEQRANWTYDDWARWARGNSYTGGGSSSGHAAHKTVDHASFFKNYGADTGSFKTKADFNKWVKQQARKLHPDLHPEDVAGYTKKMQDFNSVVDDVRHGNWYNEKLAMLMEGKGMNKVAMYEDIIYQSIEKEAKEKQYYDAIRETLTTTAPPRAATFGGRLREPEGFRGKVRHNMHPKQYNGQLSYLLLSNGPARHADLISAEKRFGDIARESYKDDKGKKEYDERMGQKINDFIEADKKFFAPIRKRRTRRAMLGALTDKEVDAILAKKKEYADIITKNPGAADRAVASTTYYY